MTVDGRRVFCLRDPSGLTDAVLTMPVAAAEILAHFDGTRSILDIQADLMRRRGALVPREQIERLIEILDRHLFLEGPRVEAEQARIATEFLGRSTRPAAHAGGAYAGEATALIAQLDGCFTSEGGPGPAGPRRAARLRGLVAPHIDFHRGGPAYAWAYKAVAEATEADCYLVFGTAHSGLDGMSFAATTKPYETPLGPVEVDREVLASLARRAPENLFAAELAHRTEHSIEFQAVCLRYVGRQGREFRIVPLLTSFAHECLARGADPATEPTVRGVLDAIRDTMAVTPRRYCLIAGADLAHVGPRFGDRTLVSPERLRQIEAEDRRLLSMVTGGDASGFYREVAADGDSRRICGLSPIYTLLATLLGERGELLSYGQWPDPHGTVTYASVAFGDAGA